MAQSLISLINAALSRLSEGQNSPSGQLTTGVGAVAISTKTTATEYLNDGSADLARGCYPLRDNGTVTATAGQSVFPWRTFTVASGATLWHAEASGVSFSGAALQHASESTLRAYYRTMATDPASTPRFWYHQGYDGIGVYPKPLYGGTLSVEGLSIPKDLVNFETVITNATNANPIVVTAAGHALVSGQTVDISGVTGNTAANGRWVITVTGADTFSIPGTGNGAYASGGLLSDVVTWFDGDLLTLLQFYTAGKLAEKNTQRQDLAVRAGMWNTEFEQGKQMLLAGLWRRDPMTALGHYPEIGK